MHSELNFTVGVNANRQSVLQDCFYSPPLKLLTLPPTAPHALHAIQMSASPGLLAGDTVNININIDKNAALSLKTQAYQRVLSMNAGQLAEQHLQVIVNDHAQFCYLPHPTVLHSGAHFKQTTRMVLGENAELIYSDIVASGRAGNGEHFAFAHLSAKTRIEYQNRPLIVDNIQWSPSIHHIEAIGQMESFSHHANLYYVHTGALDVSDKVEQLHALIELWNTATQTAGVSIVANGALQVRALANSGEALIELVQACAACLMAASV